MNFLRNYETAFIAAPLVFLLAWLFNAYRLGKFKKWKERFLHRKEK